ncbi:MAG TPA: DUF5615 family PIN-like protein [Methylomirabilota bacterium]|nr:DUF5615 family PIN-like protein [Methylomirabilota bacterium]
MAALYLDADIMPDFGQTLLARRHDVLTARDHGTLTVTDAEQLLEATRLRRILVTHNGKDFRTLCQAWPIWRRDWGLVVAAHAGVIAVPQQSRLPYPDAAAHIDRLLASRQPLWNELWYFDLHEGDWVQQI